MIECRVCHKIGDYAIYTIREMMFGTKDPFEYFECSNCGCLQIKNPPTDLSKYYPQVGYKAFNTPQNITQNSFIFWAKKKLSQLYLSTKINFLGENLSRKTAYDFIHILSYAKLKLTSQILDVGAGSGKRLISLSKKGFTNLCGSDIFIEKDYHYQNGIKILKKDISDLSGAYDFIMLNHVFEHMPEPLSVLKTLYNLLRPSKFLLIRIPVVDSYAWRKYKEHWVQLDAPRHLFLHTRKSIRLLAEKSGFRVEHMIDDSKASQFYGSEQYKNKISMFDKNSHYVNPNKSSFDNKTIKSYEKKARMLNAKNEGDSVCFFLRRE